MRNHGIRVMVGNDDADMREVRSALPRDDILARLDEIERRQGQHGKVSQTLTKIAVVTGMWRIYQTRQEGRR